MDKKTSFSACSEIGEIIASLNPVIEYEKETLEKAYSSFTRDALEELRMSGAFDGDFEKYYVINELLRKYNIRKKYGRAFCEKLMAKSRKFTSAELYHDAYINRINISDVRIGNILLTNVPYEKGEIFQYDMPDLSADEILLKLGFFDERVLFPSIYEGLTPWVSVCPSEMLSMKKGIDAAHGNVLVLGLGLGYYPFMISEKENVSSVTVIEREPVIIKIFKENILPQFPEKKKINVVEADAFEYMKNVAVGQFDFCYADIWEGAVDGASAYEKIKPYEKTLPGTEFDYWIKEQIESYLTERDE